MSTGLASRKKSRYTCVDCGSITPKWSGRCDGCGEWNTIIEESVQATPVVSLAPAMPARPITEVSTVDAQPVPTGVDEFDRVLGGGLVPGSVTLVGGEPGVGKSTLLLQLLAEPARVGAVALYLTAEESAQQVRRRAERLGALHENVFLAAETQLGRILGQIDEVGPSLVVIDSIQTVFDPELTSAPGSVAQVRHCTHRLVTLAKERDISILLVGHVTKDGSLAGPRVLEHVVDTVLAFEGGRHLTLRVLRATKHRFGSTQELGLFAMGSSGLVAVADPSEMFLADRMCGVPGSVVVPTLEGNRPFVVELQALVARTTQANPRRSVTGVDPSRVGLLLAVLERRLGISMVGLEVYAMAVGGARVFEPGADLGLGLAIVSSVAGVELPADVVACGEVGLGGELRSVGGLDRRLSEAARLGFQRAIVPRSAPEMDVGLRVLRVPTLEVAIEILGLSSVGDH